MTTQEARDLYADEGVVGCRCGWQSGYDSHPACSECGRDMCLDRSELELAMGVCAACMMPELRELYKMLGSCLTELRLIRVSLMMGHPVDVERLEKLIKKLDESGVGLSAEDILRREEDIEIAKQEARERREMEAACR